MGLPRAHRQSVRIADSLGYIFGVHLRLREQAEISWIPGISEQCGQACEPWALGLWDWGEFKILAISQVTLFAKRRVYQSGRLPQSRISCWTALRTSTWNAGHHQNWPSPLRTSPFIVVLSPWNDRSFALGLILFPLHLCILRDISLMCLPTNGWLSTHLSTALFWRSVTDPMLWSQLVCHWDAFPSSLHPPHSWRSCFPSTALAMTLSGLKPLMASHSLLNQAQARAAEWFLPPLPLFTGVHLSLLPPCPP